MRNEGVNMFEGIIGSIQEVGIPEYFNISSELLEAISQHLTAANVGAVGAAIGAIAAAIIAYIVYSDSTSPELFPSYRIEGECGFLVISNYTKSCALNIKVKPSKMSGRPVILDGFPRLHEEICIPYIPPMQSFYLPVMSANDKFDWRIKDCPEYRIYLQKFLRTATLVIRYTSPSGRRFCRISKIMSFEARTVGREITVNGLTIKGEESRILYGIDERYGSDSQSLEMMKLIHKSAGNIVLELSAGNRLMEKNLRKAEEEQSSADHQTSSL